MRDGDLPLVSVLAGGEGSSWAGRRRRPAAGGEPWRALETLEPRMLLDGVWDLLSEVWLARGVDYDLPGDRTEYGFSLSFHVEAGSGLESAALETPGGQRFDITDRNDAGDVEEWEFEFVSLTSRGLSAFGAGLYTLELDFGAGPETTQFLFGMPGTGDPLPAVSQRPIFTSPAHAQAMDGEDLTVTWRPVTDAGVNTIFLSVEQQDGDDAPVAEAFDDTSTTTHGPVSLTADLLYQCELDFAHIETNTNANGVDYSLATYTSASVVINTFTEINPDLVVEVTGTTLPDTLVPGDRGTVTVVVTNYGRAAAVGLIDFDANAESDGDGVYLGAAFGRRLNLGVGRSGTFRVNVEVPADAPPGEYWLSVTAFSDVDEIDPMNNTDWSDESRELVWCFGSFAGRRNVRLTVLDSFGVAATFRMSGPGFGTVSDSGDGLQADLDSTTSGSTVRVGRLSSEEYPCLSNVNAPGSLAGLVAPQVNLSGSINVPGSLRSLSLYDVLDSGAAALTIGQPERASWSTRMTFHEVAALAITSEMPIGSLTARLFNGSATCPRVGALRTTAGDLNAAMEIGAGGVGSIRVYGGDFLGNLVSEGPVGNITVIGVAQFDSDAQEGAIVGGNLLCSPITAGPGAGRGKSLGNVALTAGSFGTGDEAVEVTAAGNVGNFRVNALRYKLNVEEVEVLDRWGEPRTDANGDPIMRRVTHYSRQGGGIWVTLETPGRLGSLTTAGGDLGGEIHAAGGMGRISLQALLLGSRTSWLGMPCTDGEVVAANLTAQLTAEPGAGAVAIPSISVRGGDVTGGIVLDGKLGAVTVECCAQRSEEGAAMLIGGSLSSEEFQASAIGNLKLVGGAFAVAAQSATRIGSVSVVAGEMDGSLTARDAIGNVTLRALTVNASYHRTWMSEEGEGWWEFESTEGYVVGFGSEASLNIDLGGTEGDLNPRATLGVFSVTAASLTANGTIPFDPANVRSVERDRRYAESYEMDDETGRVTRNNALAEGVFTNNLTQV